MILSSVLVPTIQGEDFIIENDRYYILTDKIKGKALSPKEIYGDNRRKISKKYGYAIGNLHNVLRGFDEDIEVNDNNLLKTVEEWALPETKYGACKGT